MASTAPVSEIQISSIEDDGSPEGLARVKLIQGEVIKIPASAMEVYSGSRIRFGSATVVKNGKFNINKDGTASAIQLNNVSASLSNQSAIQFIVYGRVVGIRFYRSPANISGSTPPFSVVIDDISYDIDPYMQNARIGNIDFTPDTEYGGSGTPAGVGDSEVDYIVADNLPDKAHSVTIINYPSAILTKSIFILGILVERRGGYKETTPLDFLYNQSSLTTSSVVMPMFTTTFGVLKCIKRVMYYNGDTLARTVTITYNAKVICVLDIAAGKTASYDFTNNGVMVQGDLSVSNGFAHQVDAITTTAVTYSIIGGK